MKTRTLLLLAVGTALAILLAGGVLLLQLSNEQGGTAPTTIGEAVDIGDVTVTVGSASESDGRLTVEMTVGGVDDSSWYDTMRLVTGDERLAPRSDGGAEACAALTVEVRDCAVVFDVSSVDSSSRVLVMVRGDDRATWRLDRG